jgi:1-deoxy-D-xylulose-5-phosphate reductoisomerase
MRIPIQYALTFPERQNSELPPLELSQVRALEFYEVDEKRYPLLPLARQALEEEKSLPVALNAANEAAVEAFLGRRIGFSSIADVVRKTLDKHKVSEIGSLEAVFEVDKETRAQAENLIKQRF